MTENTGNESKTERRVYNYDDVMALTHIASVHGKTQTMLRELGTCGSLIGQAIGFDKTSREDYVRVVQYLNKAHDELVKATQVMTAIQTSVVGRQHVIDEIVQGLNSGPWQGGNAESVTYPNGVPVDPSDLIGRKVKFKTDLVGEPPVPSPNTD